MQTASPILSVQNLRRDFKMGDETVHALRGVSFDIYPGEFVTIMGTSGSGKSTMLNILGCMDRPTSGHYILDGQHTETLKRSPASGARNSDSFSRATTCSAARPPSKTWNSRYCTIPKFPLKSATTAPSKR